MYSVNHLNSLKFRCSYHASLYRDSDGSIESISRSNFGVGKSSVSRSASKFILINALANDSMKKERER